MHSVLRSTEFNKRSRGGKLRLSEAAELNTKHL